MGMGWGAVCCRSRRAGCLGTHSGRLTCPVGSETSQGGIEGEPEGQMSLRYRRRAFVCKAFAGDSGCQSPAET